MTHDPWMDPDQHTHRLERVERYTSGGGWEIGFDGGMATGISDERNTIKMEPMVGDEYTYWGKGFGSPYRGQALNGIILWYETEEEYEVRFKREIEERKRKKKEEFLKTRKQYDQDISQLPLVFQQRFIRFQGNNRDFDWESGPYELMCCQDAVRIAGSLRNADAVEDFQKADWKTQQAIVPGISHGHSGNSFGVAVHLAYWYLKEPEMVPKLHGALCPLVGCIEYGCVPNE